ncbi:MAG: hypothetical protein ACRELB_24825 [Polyangiaceae bacterium]
MPPEALQLVREAILRASSKSAEDTRRLLARVAVDPGISRAERPLARFLFYQATRANLIAGTWTARRHLLQAGIDDAAIDRVAADEVSALMAHPEWLDGPDPVRPLHLLVAGGLARLVAEHEEIIRAVADVREELTYWARRRAELDELLRDMNARDAVLIRNFLASAFDEQKLEIDRLMHEHPLLYHDTKRGAIDQRLSRLRRSVEQAGPAALPVRRAPALIDLLLSHEVGGSQS